MYVDWEAPAGPARKPTVVFVHGGGGQSLDWRYTVDGRPGWSDVFVAAGHPVYLVDRPGHGRSRGIAHDGPVGDVPSDDQAAFLFAGGPDAADQTQWTWPRDGRSDEVRSLTASSAGLARDIAGAERREADRLIGLLDRIGPAVLVTHSLGACCGWVAAAERPALVRAVVALEPVGPPFGAIPGVGELTWGLTATPLPHDPTPTGPASLRATPERYPAPGLAGCPIAIVASSASPLRATAAPAAEFLRSLGARAEVVDLADHGFHGNGHALMREANSDAVAAFVSEWIVAAMSVEPVREV
jgi:pimeloyl-ACP methyl ester carboxylesterase